MPAHAPLLTLSLPVAPYSTAPRTASLQAEATLQTQLGFDGPGAGTDEVHRLFFALWPDEGVRDGIEAAADALRHTHAPRGRWIGRHRYHLTLQFLGDSPVLREDVANAAMHAAESVRVQAFDLALDVAGSFRNRSVPWWLGCAHAPPALQQLFDTLGGALRRNGLRLESGKGLVAHVTVLRNADSALPTTAIAPVPWPVRDFVLVHSVLGRRSAYHLLGRWPLSAP
jgi:RNA 2',3'-cyclic 3'-phosphodiesterase